MPDEDVTFTQDDVTAAATRAAKEAARAERRKVEAEYAEKLGGKTLDEIAAERDAAEEKRKGELTEAQRIAADAEKVRTEAEAVKAEAARDRFDAKLDRKLLAAGVGAGIPDTDTDKATKVEKALDRARRMLGLAPDATDDEITAEIATAKTEVPSLFAATTEVVKPFGGRTPPAPAKPPAVGGSTTSIDPARERARQRVGYTPPASAAS